MQGLVSALCPPPLTQPPAIGSSTQVPVYTVRNIQPACILLEGKSSPPQSRRSVSQSSHSMYWQVTRPRFPTVATGTAKGFSALTFEASFVTLAASRLPCQSRPLRSKPCR